ncbi:hypothetical protein [Herpetosiphon gulosus]|uniref:DUF4935 domain-containing protein n=1 Tax=Herpetosiphon gulosus TaxID=1973496 RepID=A0ABP9WWY0_9CHLR
MISDVEKKRSILLTTKLRFSPEIQPLKQTVINNIILQIIYTNSSLNRWRIETINEKIYSQIGHQINNDDLNLSLKSLISQEMIEELNNGGHKTYKLSDIGKKLIDKHQIEAENRLDRVLHELFSNSEIHSSLYTDPFLDVISRIFSKIGEDNARLIKGDLSNEDLLNYISLPDIIKGVVFKSSNINYAVFESGINNFFRKNDPDFDIIKWNMAQNYYITKSLGIDPSGSILSKELYENAVFYLDTNIIITALEENHEYHHSFLFFIEMCSKLNISINICQISLDEMNEWLSYQREIIEKTISNIPDGLSSKINSLIYDIYLKKVELHNYENIDDLFTSFSNASNKLESEFEIKLFHNDWFSNNNDKPEVNNFAEKIRDRYFKTRNRKKSRRAPKHDALLLMWIEKERREKSLNTWLITADSSLPGIVPNRSIDSSLAITMDAIIQWISPVNISNEDEFSSIFSEMIKLRLFPQNKIFMLEDFLIFHEMNISCKELPIEDVEQCIRYIKRNIPNMDISKSSDRERLHYEMSRFFKDPSRKYQEELSKLEREKSEMSMNFEREKSEMSMNFEREKLEINNSISDFREKLSNMESEININKIKSIVNKKMFRSVLLLFIVISITVYIAEGNTFYEKISGWWQVYTFIFGVWIFLVSIWIGKEGLRTLGWPFTKIFGIEDK